MIQTNSTQSECQDLSKSSFSGGGGGGGPGQLNPECQDLSKSAWGWGGSESGGTLGILNQNFWHLECVAHQIVSHTTYVETNDMESAANSVLKT